MIAEGDVDNGKAATVEPAEALAMTASDYLVVTVDPRGDYSCDSTTVTWAITTDAGEAWHFPAEVRDQFLEPD